MIVKKTLKSLNEIQPEPVTGLDFGEDDNPNFKKRTVLGIPVFPSSPVPVLKFVQKYSTWPMSVYFPLHAINTLIIPLFDPNYTPNEVLMMVRQILPSAYVTAKILVTSLSLHLGAGIIIRGINLWNKRRLKNKTPVRKPDDSQSAIGLTGGISGYIFGVNKIFEISPQILSGYILTPLLAYHLFLMVAGPRLVKFDIDFSFVKWVLQNDNTLIKWVGGIIPLSLLVWSGTYHICAGDCQYLSIKDMNNRRRWSNAITMLIASGLFSLYRLSRSSSGLLSSKQFSEVFKILNFIKV